MVADQSSFLKPILLELVSGASAWKAPVKVVSLTNVTPAGVQIIDGTTIDPGDSVLLIGQSAGAENGIWLAAAGTWTRRDDAASNAGAIPELTAGVTVRTTHGSLAGKVYRLTTTTPINIGTTPQAWIEDLPPGGAVTNVSGTSPIQSTGGATPVISITAATGLAAGSMSAPDKAKLDAATTSATADTLMLRDASGAARAAWFYGAGTVASDGLLRAANNGVIVASRNATNVGDFACVATDSSDNVLVGPVGTGTLGQLVLRSRSSTSFTLGLSSVLTLGASLADFLTLVRLPATDPTAVRQVGAEAGGRIRLYVSGAATSVVVESDVTTSTPYATKILRRGSSGEAEAAWFQAGAAAAVPGAGHLRLPDAAEIAIKGDTNTILLAQHDSGTDDVNLLINAANAYIAAGLVNFANPFLVPLADPTAARLVGAEVGGRLRLFVGGAATSTVVESDVTITATASKIVRRDTDGHVELGLGAVATSGTIRLPDAGSALIKALSGNLVDFAHEAGTDNLDVWNGAALARLNATLVSFTNPFLLPDTDPTAVRRFGAESDGRLRMYVDSAARSSAIVPNVSAVQTSAFTAAWDATYRFDASGGAFTATLTTAAGNTGRIVTFVNDTDSFVPFTIDGAGAETINGSATLILAEPRSVAVLQSDGTNVRILNRVPPKVKLTTASDTPVDVLTIPLPLNSMLTVYVEASAKDSTGATVAEWRARNSWQRTSGGTSTRVGTANGTQDSVANQFAITRPTITFGDPSVSNNGTVIATGKLSTTVNWDINFRYHMVL